MKRRVEIRDAGSADAAGIARVHVDTWRATYRGIVPDARLDGMSHAASAERWAGELASPTEPGWFALVAVDEGQVVGFATGGRERTGHAEYRGEIGGIYILPEYQMQGIGRLLVAEAAGRLTDAGLDGLLIWVLRDNPSHGFYERLGGVCVSEKVIDIGGADLVEVAYGWPDARVLLG